MSLFLLFTTCGSIPSSILSPFHCHLDSQDGRGHLGPSRDQPTHVETNRENSCFLLHLPTKGVFWKTLKCWETPFKIKWSVWVYPKHAHPKHLQNQISNDSGLVDVVWWVIYPERKTWGLGFRGQGARTRGVTTEPRSHASAIHPLGCEQKSLYPQAEVSQKKKTTTTITKTTQNNSPDVSSWAAW